MIAQAEIQRTSGALGISQDVVEHDYALGCFLHFLGELPEIKHSWVFKGGSCLAKCHFSQYRFSEDLDFTLMETILRDALTRLLDQAKEMTQTGTGIRLDVRSTAVEIIEDDYGKESFEAKVYYEGIWRPRGSPRAIRVHANRDEPLLFPVLSLGINHSYSDAAQLPNTTMQVYALEEIVSEKLRALSGQRKYAVARDLYDLWNLAKAGVNMDSALEAFPEKCLAKGLNPTSRDLARLVRDRGEYEANWRNNLEYLVPADLRCPFSEAWDVARDLLRRALHS
jgi:predicted nucleotidyltransferase component of viral defense system